MHTAISSAVFLLISPLCFAQAPIIVSVYPEQNALNIERNSNIVVTFDGQMDQSTIHGSSFIVYSKSLGILQGAISYNELTNAAAFDPNSDFYVGDIILVILTDDIKSLNGNSLESGFAWTFSVITDAGNGYFNYEDTYGVSGEPFSIISADFNNDGATDVATITWDTDSLFVLLNSGNGAFPTINRYLTGDAPESMIAADFNGDQAIDLAIGNYYSHNISIFLNVGDGTFTSQVLYPTGNGPGGLISCDFNADGYLDLAVSNWNDQTISKLAGNGDGTFEPRIDYAFGYRSSAICPIDVDNDGDFDLGTANRASDTYSIFLNLGNGEFLLENTYSSVGGPHSIFPSDLDSDGCQDIAIGNSFIDNILIAISDCMGGYGSNLTYPSGQETLSVQGADLDNDGDMDLFAVNAEDDNLSIFLNQGDGTFLPSQTIPIGDRPFGCCTGDFDGDGDMDIATANRNSHNISILLNSYNGPVWYISTSGSTILGDGSENYPFATIQKGIDVANEGDTVLVTDGIYIGVGNRDLDFGGKNLVVQSLNGAEYTVLDCESIGRGFFFHNGEDTSSTVDGFTIKNGTDNGLDAGGGIRLLGAHPTVLNCIFISNTARHGGAIYLNGNYLALNIRIAGCTFINNSAQYSGGAMFMQQYGETLLMQNCTFFANSANSGTGLANSEGAVVENCIFSYGFDGGAITGSPSLACCDIFANIGGDWTSNIIDQFGINGNIASDPQFCDTASQNLHIYDFSPCAASNNQCEILIGALDVGCYLTSILSFEIESEASMENVINHFPKFIWNYGDSREFNQTQFEIAVGTDDDWQYAEMWNPGPFESSDTFVVYAGATLDDGETYFVRLRLGDNGAWTEWYETSFRMNSVPSVPVLTSPVDNSFTNLQPLLSLQTSTDAEDDVLYYIFQILNDAQDTITTSQPILGLDNWTAVWQCDVELIENEHYSWRAKATDTYEESEWSPLGFFYANAVNSAPSAFSLILPPDTSGLPLTTVQPTFYWSSSTDPDPLDSVLFTLIIATDSNFNFANQVPEIDATEYTLQTELEWGDRYWWKVKAEDQYDGLTWSSNVLNFWTMICGDANNDKAVNVSDAVYIINFVFVGGAQPIPYEAGDANCDGSVNVSDAVWIINYVFIGGNVPCDTDGDDIPDC